MPVFVQLIRPQTPMSTLSSVGKAALAAHFGRLQEGVAQGAVLLAGPCEDEAFGIVLFVATDAHAAQAWAEADLAVQAGVMSSEVHPFRVSLRGQSWPTD